MNGDMSTVNNKRVHLCWLVGWKCRWKGGERVDYCVVDGNN
jgi:hypothetical protein